MFDENLKKVFTNIPFEEVESYQVEYEKRKCLRIISFERSEKVIIGSNSIKYIYFSLNRSMSLYSSFVDNANLKHSLAFSLIARAHLETTAGIGYLFWFLKEFYGERITYDTMLDITISLLLGYKTSRQRERIEETPESINVLTMIKKIEKVYLNDVENKEKWKKDRPISYFHEYLSESCHPNFEGLISGVVSDGTRVMFKTSDENLELFLSQAMLSMSTSCMIFFDIFDRSISLLKENGRLPTIIK